MTNNSINLSKTTSTEKLGSTTMKNIPLSEKERHQLLVEWNNTEIDYFEDVLIHQLFEAQVQKTPDAVAVAFEDKQLTYRELNEQANKLAHHLRAIGIGSGQCVAVFMNRSLEIIPALLGILKSGAAYIPLEPSYPDARVQWIFSSLNISCMVTQTVQLEPMQSLLSQLSALKDLICLDTLIPSDSDSRKTIQKLSDHQQIWMYSDLSQYSESNLSTQNIQNELAYIIFTSGSTGTPKGVMVRHKSVINLIDWVNRTFDVNSSDRVLFITSLCFDLSVYDIFGLLAAGGSIQVVSDIDIREPRSLLRMLSEKQITLWNSAPPVLQQLVPFFKHTPIDKNCQLRLVFLSGDWIPVNLPTLVKKRFQNVEIVSLGGATEATVWSNYYVIKDVDPHWSSIPYGKPIQNTQYYILGSSLEPCQIGVSGELYIGGDCLSDGYVNEPEKTAKQFVSNPFNNEPDSRLYKTGDLARYMPDGNIEFIGRIDNQVKIRGFRIETGEIESVLSQHSNVKENVVLAQPDTFGNKRLIAYLVPDLEDMGSESPISELESEYVSNWQNTYEQVYQQVSTKQDSIIDFIGWNSSYTGLPIPSDEMYQWVDFTVQRILALNPKRVLEIGCGTGLLLSKIAPHCNYYLGTDISQASLQHIEDKIQHIKGGQNVNLLQRMADDFHGIETEVFDTVIINSVAQYFPNISYLLSVIENAVSVLKSGGFIFIGDIRNLLLLDKYHASVQFYKATASTSLQQLEQRIQQNVVQEQELLIDPEFFTSLKQYLPQISHVQMQLKRGTHHNELTKFRYDVILYVESNKSIHQHQQDITTTSEIDWLDWNKHHFTIADISQLLIDKQPKTLRLSNIANDRLQMESKVCELLNDSINLGTVEELRQELSRSDNFGIDPEDWRDLNIDLPYSVDINWSNSSTDGSYDVTFRMPSAPKIVDCPPDKSSFISWNTYANNPLQVKLTKKLIPELRQFLESNLPKYMVPSIFMLLESIPLTINGKVDRRALPKPDAKRQLAANFVAPRTTVEKILTDVWTYALGIDEISIHDNFFELGGDSILSIEIIAKAYQAGLQLTLTQIFQNSTIAELAAVVSTATAVVAEQGLVTGLVPLTPIQQWFFEQKLLKPEHWNWEQAILLESPSTFDVLMLEQILKQLLIHHDALRLRFEHLPSGWRQNIILPEEEISCHRIDISTLSKYEQEVAIEKSFNELQTSLNLSKGPLVTGVIFDLGANKFSRLLLVIHHLIVDGVSWRILLSDLQLAYQQLLKGDKIRLPAKTTSFKDWAERLTAFAKSKKLTTEQDYWLSESRSNVFALPVDYPGDKNNNTVTSTENITVSLSVDQTSALLQEIPRTYNTQINDVLLTALILAFKHWTGSSSLLIDMEGHGREEIIDEVNMSRTIGWFTTIFPLLLALGKTDNLGDALKSIKEQLRNIPNKGIGYGLLRYLKGDTEITNQLSSLPQSTILFNYLGQFDQALPKSSNFNFAKESIGYTRDPQGIRRHQIEITGFVTGEELQLNWIYSTNFYRRETIESLAENFVQEIQSLINHCQSLKLESHMLSSPIDEQRTDSLLPAVVSAPNQRYSPFPLTDMQQAYWVGQSKAFELGNARAHVYVEFDNINLDLERCNLALEKLIRRHEMLRVIVLPDGQQQILEQVPSYKIRVSNLCEKDSETVNSQLEAVRQRMSHQGPDTDKWPLFEVIAHQLKDQCVRLHISMSLLIMDGRAALILAQEFWQLYCNSDDSLETLDLSFRDYVLTLDRMQDQKAYQHSLNYWRKRLSSLPSAPELPIVKNLTSISSPRFKRRSAKLEPETWLRLRTRAAQAGLTPTVVLCTAYSDVLAMWSKKHHFALNLLFFNRLPLHSQVNNIVGNFSSTILLEVNNVTESNFEARARNIQQQLWSELEHSRVSGVKVLREKNRTDGNTSKATLPVVFASTLNLNSQNDETEEVSLPGELVYSSLQTPQVLLDHQVYNYEGALLFNWDAVEEAFPEQLLDDMFDTYCRFLHHLADEEETWHKSVLELIPSKQLQQRMLINSTEAPIHTEMLHTLFEKQVARQPQRTAITSSNKTLTYKELDSRSNQIAYKLNQLGARPNILVAVVMEKGWEQVVAVLGILKSGAAYLPIDPALPKERLFYLLEQSQMDLVLTESRTNDKLIWPNNIQRFCVDKEELNEVDYSPLKLVQTPEDLAYVIFTSGSTGLPKGVMIGHGSVVNTICDVNQRFGVSPEDRLLALSSLSFDLSVYDIFGILAAGGTIVIPNAHDSRDPSHWADLLVQEKITIWNSVPALMQMLVEYAETRPEISLCRLRLVLLSGDWIPKIIPTQIRNLFDNVQIISLGGATEASIWSISYPIEDVNSFEKSIPYGKPMLNQRVYVLNEILEPSPIWVIGSLYIGGVGLAKGYWKNDKKTNTSFIEHPRTGERLYYTGDLGRYLPDGNIEFLGREDSQVKVQGYRIELGEIETSIKQYPAIQSVVTAVSNRINSNKSLVAYITVKQDSDLDTNELRSFLNEKLPDYMIPSTFVLLETMPLTSNGKIDRKALPEYKQLMPEETESFVSPSNSSEYEIASIWQDLLNVDSIGITENFFDFGGDSLLAVRLVARIKKQFGHELSLSVLLQEPTIKHLARTLRQKDSSVPQSSLVKIQSAGSKPPFFCVHPVGGNVLCYVDLARHLNADRPFYGLQSQGLDGKRNPYAQIEEMVFHYIEELREVQPEGPYSLGGWSMGGIIAFEMAKVLHEQKQEVSSLVLIDSSVPSNMPSNIDDNAILSKFVRDLGSQFAENSMVSPDKFSELESNERLHYVLNWAKEANILHSDVEVSQIQRLLQVFKANTQAMSSYQPNIYSSKVVILRASEVLPVGFEDFDFDKHSLGWDRFVSKPIEIHTVPGNHYTILTKSNVEVLARKLKNCLE